MRNPSRSRTRRPAFTLLEMTVVILVLLILIGTGLFASGKYREWSMGRKAGETLRGVYTAQRMYLADHPTRPVANITMADLLPYLPGAATDADGALLPPEAESLENTPLDFVVTESPPYLATGATRYDPSGNPTDGLWDVGE